ncbi:CPBP family intramembrane glutamic endopeptidase [Fodinicola acaciae]|uniref:CPBP family intramembrane glutamic endopeptidase n=1 Tax=Fodinicola acaciae TaxID=2681555 RepID=UPI0013D541B1|nr:CPBP family intramembrane glutamic endopeptidase [Fodinicola acaciae]
MAGSTGDLLPGNDVRAAALGLAGGVSKNTKGILAFLAISFGFAWAGMFGTHLWLGLSLVNPLVQLPWAFSPAIAAVVVRKWVTKEGFADAGLRFRWRGNLRWYLISWLGPLALAVVAVVIAAVVGLWRFDLSILDHLVPGLPGWACLAILMVVTPLLAPIYWGEEFGWTSYLRLRLWTDRPALSVIATGLIWAIWHYPLAFLGYIEFTNVTLGLLVWTVSFQFQEILLAWIRVRSGSIWPTSIAHAGNNMVFSLLTGILLEESGKLDVITVMLITTAALALAAVLTVLNRRFRRDLASLSPTQADAHSRA